MLSERGLVEALRAFAARSPLPATITADVDTELPERVELAAYFVVAEALTNAAKHSGARRADVRLVREGGRLSVEVSDDGRGGADPRGDGLEGLRKRVAALDGTLRVASPPGGPTLVRAELPCAS
jgi:signal transduction histidine kinase